MGVPPLGVVGAQRGPVLLNVLRKLSCTYGYVKGLGRDGALFLVGRRGILSGVRGASGIPRHHFTDPDSHSMGDGERAFVQVSNAQVAVETSQQIVACACPNPRARARNARPDSQPANRSPPCRPRQPPRAGHGTNRLDHGLHAPRARRLAGGGPARRSGPRPRPDGTRRTTRPAPTTPRSRTPPVHAPRQAGRQVEPQPEAPAEAQGEDRKWGSHLQAPAAARTAPPHLGWGRCGPSKIRAIGPPWGHYLYLALRLTPRRGPRLAWVVRARRGVVSLGGGAPPPGPILPPGRSAGRRGRLRGAARGG